MNVYVDDDFVRVGGKSYAIDKINSIEVREGRPDGRLGAIITAIIAAFFSLMTLLSAFGLVAGGASTAAFVTTLLVGALTVWMWRRVKILWSRAGTRDYELYLMTSSSQLQAFTTRDENEIATLQTEIESAMMRRSRR